MKLINLFVEALVVMFALVSLVNPAYAKPDCNRLFKKGMQEAYNEIMPQLEVYYAKNEAYIKAMREKVKTDHSELATKIRKVYGVDPATEKDKTEWLNQVNNTGSPALLFYDYTFDQDLMHPKKAASCSFNQIPVEGSQKRLAIRYTAPTHYFCADKTPVQNDYPERHIPNEEINVAVFSGKKDTAYELSDLSSKPMRDHVYYKDGKFQMSLYAGSFKEPFGGSVLKNNETRLQVCTEVNGRFKFHASGSDVSIKQTTLLNICSSINVDNWDHFQNAEVTREELTTFYNMGTADAVMRTLPSSCQKQVVGSAFDDDPTGNGGSGGGGIINNRLKHKKRTAMLDDSEIKHSRKAF